MQLCEIRMEFDIVRKILSWRLVSAITLAAVTITGTLWVIDQPTVANHFGYALSGEKGLPYRLRYGQHSYISPMTCAGANWCEVEKTPKERASPYCTPGTLVRQEIKGSGLGPLVRAGHVTTLFGSPHEIYVIGNLSPGQTTVDLYVESARNDCYVDYILSGGP